MSVPVLFSGQVSSSGPLETRTTLTGLLSSATVYFPTDLGGAYTSPLLGTFVEGKNANGIIKSSLNTHGTGYYSSEVVVVEGDFTLYTGNPNRYPLSSSFVLGTAEIGQNRHVVYGQFTPDGIFNFSVQMNPVTTITSEQIYLYQASEGKAGICLESTFLTYVYDAGGFVATPDFQYQIRVGEYGNVIDVPMPIDMSLANAAGSGSFIIHQGVFEWARQFYCVAKGFVEVPFSNDNLYVRLILNDTVFSWCPVVVAPMVSLDIDIDVEEVFFDASQTFFLFNQPANDPAGDFTFAGTRTNGTRTLAKNSASTKAILDYGDIKYSNYSQNASASSSVKGRSHDRDAVGTLSKAVTLQNNASADETLGPRVLAMVYDANQEGNAKGAQIYRLSPDSAEGLRGAFLANALPVSLHFRNNGTQECVALTFELPSKKWVLRIYASPESTTALKTMTTSMNDDYIGVRGYPLFGGMFFIVGRKFNTNEIWCDVTFDLVTFSQLVKIGDFAANEPHALTCYQKTATSGSPQIVVTNCKKTHFHSNNFGKNWKEGLE
jgi:hypothetical protein